MGDALIEYIDPILKVLNLEMTQTDVQTTPLKVDIGIQCNILPCINQEQKNTIIRRRRRTR